MKLKSAILIVTIELLPGIIAAPTGFSPFISVADQPFTFTSSPSSKGSAGNSRGNSEEYINSQSNGLHQGLLNGDRTDAVLGQLPSASYAPHQASLQSGYGRDYSNQQLVSGQGPSNQLQPLFSNGQTHSVQPIQRMASLSPRPSTVQLPHLLASGRSHPIQLPQRLASGRSFSISGNRYQVSSKPLGSGVAGTVYRAYHPDSTEPVALKVYKKRKRGPEYMTEKDNLQRAGELKTAGKTSSGNLALVMRYQSGEPFDEYLSRATPEEYPQLKLKWEDAFRKFHAKTGMVHGDPLPVNALINSKGSVRLVDLEKSYIPDDPQELKRLQESEVVAASGFFDDHVDPTGFSDSESESDV